MTPHLVADFPDAQVTFDALALDQPASVDAFAQRTRASLASLTDLVIFMDVSVGDTVAPESQLGSLHLGAFSLAHRLRDLLVENAPARIVTVTSWNRSPRDRSSRRDRREVDGYCLRANLMFTAGLNQSLEGRAADIRAVACHLGLVARRVAWGSAGLLQQLRTAWQELSPRRAAELAMQALVQDVPAGKLLTRRGLARIRQTHNDATRRLWVWAEAESGVRLPPSYTKG